MSEITTILSWAEWIVLVLIGIEIVIASWKISVEHNLDEGFRKVILVTAGGVLILSMTNYLVPQVNNIIPSAILSLPGANYIVDLAIASFGIGAIYGGYLVAKGDLEHGFEMLGLVAVMFVLMASASSLFTSSSLPTNVQLQQIVANGQTNGISLNFLADIIQLATLLPSGGGIQSLTNLVDQYASAIAVVGLIILAVWRFLFDMETELMRYLVTIVKDVVVVSILIAGSLSIWSGFAEIMNGLIAIILNSSNVQTFLNEMVVSMISWLALGISTGYFVPFLAQFSASLLEISLIALDLALARYLIISAVIGLAPILAGLWLVPPLRKVVQVLADFVLGIAIGGLVSAGAIYILANSGILTDLVVAFAPFVIGILPWAVGIAFSGIGASTGGGILGRGLQGGGLASGSSSSSSSSSSSVVLQNTKQHQVPQTTTLNRPTIQTPPQQTQPQQTSLTQSIKNAVIPPTVQRISKQQQVPQTKTLNSPTIQTPQQQTQQTSLVQSIKNVVIPPTVQRIMNRQTIQTQAPIGNISSALPPGFKVKSILNPNPVTKPLPKHTNVTVGNTTYGTGLRLIPKGISKIDTVVSQGKIAGNSISGSTSNATADVIAQETKFHAFLDALKQNAVVFTRQFDLSLQKRLGISFSMLRVNYQDMKLNRPTTVLSHPIIKKIKK